MPTTSLIGLFNAVLILCSIYSMATYFVATHLWFVHNLLYAPSVYCSVAHTVIKTICSLLSYMDLFAICLTHAPWLFVALVQCICSLFNAFPICFGHCCVFSVGVGPRFFSVGITPFWLLLLYLSLTLLPISYLLA